MLKRAARLVVIGPLKSAPSACAWRKFSGQSADKVAPADVLLAWAESAKATEGITPEQFRMMMSKPEVIEIFKCPKMQRVLEDVAVDGPESVTRHLSDPEVRRGR